MEIKIHYIHNSDESSDIYTSNGLKIGTISEAKGKPPVLYISGVWAFRVVDLEILIEAMKNRKIDLEFGS